MNAHAEHGGSPEERYHAGRLGMWLLLATEVLMFSGLFCAYAVYRRNHPEVFHYASRLLNWKLGGLNTLVLITSSLTMALAVRSAQLGRQRSLVPLLGCTILCGAIFMGVKGIEYRDKWRHHLLPGTHFRLEPEHTEAGAKETPRPPAPPTTPATAATKTDAWNGPPPGEPPHGLAKAPIADAQTQAGPPPAYVPIFFSIYFLMTGLHGLHVLAGMGILTWIMLRARRGDFGPRTFTPVDLAGLFWHLVDIIWIFLFPLLYLIR